MNGVVIADAFAAATGTGAQVSPVRRDGISTNGSCECLKGCSIVGVDGSIDIARSWSLVDAIEIVIVSSPPSANVALTMRFALILGWLLSAFLRRFLVACG